MYRYIIDQMTWSYSRISSYRACPYQFYLKYIQLEDEAPMFFSGYGSFLHKLIAQFCAGEKSRPEIVSLYLQGFQSEVYCAAPNRSLSAKYFLQGLRYLQSMELPVDHILSVEQRVEFDLCGHPFIGYIDAIGVVDGEFSIVDHKSRDLKPRSGRSKPTKSDQELDAYLRQLYLYSIPIHEMYSTWPDSLIFNCYRTGVRIREPFCQIGLEGAKDWAVSSIREIRSTQKWIPNLDYFKCRHLCGVSHACEYFQLWGGDRN